MQERIQGENEVNKTKKSELEVIIRVDNLFLLETRKFHKKIHFCHIY